LINSLSRHINGSTKPSISLNDSTLLVLVDTLDAFLSSKTGFPFKSYYYPYEGDSIETAIKVILGFLEESDSSQVNLTGISNLKTPVWINSKNNKMVRYWLRNQYSDSAIQFMYNRDIAEETV
jgi:hypothetical protein